MGLFVRARVAKAILVVSSMCLACGCQVADKSDSIRSKNVVLVLPGIDGAGPWYNSLTGGLKEGGDEVHLVHWGMPLLFLANLTFPVIHSAAERGLAQRIRQERAEHPDGRITLVGHSAGCGVILQALARLETGLQVETVVLLAPAVSEDYDLAPAISHTRGTVHVFYSSHDQMLLSTCVTGTYDHVFSNSGGLNGFALTERLAATARVHLIQHAYDPAWKTLGCEGGHFGWRSKPFVEQVLVPLMEERPSRAAIAKSPELGAGT